MSTVRKKYKKMTLGNLGAPVLFAKKKDKTLGLCIDYR